MHQRFMTYWEQLKYNGKKVERVVLNPDIKQYAEKYEKIMNLLLEEGETFVDFINKTLLYSLLRRENPVYISQSPLQLSGEFTQKEFIKQIKGIPIILMPIDVHNYRASNSLDGISNLYRNYLVGEYIFQNYIPLCRYENDYAIWCLKDRINEYKEKITKLVKSKNYINQLVKNESLEKYNVELLEGNNGSVKMNFKGRDPMITELQNVIDINDYINTNMQICIDYITDTAGVMQIYYTNDKGEGYIESKSVLQHISGQGTAYFSIPITKYSRIRLDTPEGSNVILKSLITTIENPIKLIDYGYDGPLSNINADGAISYAYTSALHNYYIGQLPRIWAENDKKQAIDNPVIVDTILDNDNRLFTFDPTQIDKSKGNYCLISITYDGLDTGGLYDNDDEKIDAAVIFCNNSTSNFGEKCKYVLSLKEGKHNYLIRCSTDYYWYLNQINSFIIVTNGKIYDVSASILEGD